VRAIGDLAGALRGAHAAASRYYNVETVMAARHRRRFGRLGYAGVAALALLGVAEWVQTGATFFGDDRLRWYAQDFPAFYTAAYLVAAGSGHLIYDTTAMAAAELAIAGGPVGGSGVLAYFNPPFFALLLAPLTGLPLDRAYQAWTLFSLALLAIDVAMLWAITAPMPRAWRLALVAGFVTLFPVAYGLQHGQFSLILVTSWTAAFLLLRRRRDALAGAVLSPLLIKPELLIPVTLYLAWKRRWGAIAALAPITALAVAASFATVGVTAALGYPGYLIESTTWDDRGVNTAQMFGWNGLIAMFHDPSDPFGYAATIVLTLAALLAVRSSCADEAEARPNGFARSWLLLTIATILVDPHFYLQDTVLLGPPAIALMAGVRPHVRSPLAWALLAGWGLLALGTFPNQHLHVNAFALYMAAAAVALVVRMNAAPASAGTPATC
jgi:hypothetical protein